MINSTYFTCLENLLSHFHSLPEKDYGLMTHHSWNRLSKAVKCKHNLSNPSRNPYPCLVCEVCRGNQVYSQFMKISSRTFSPLMSHNHYYSIVLSLPKWPVGIPEINGCRNFGELFFVTPSLFQHLKDVPLNSTLSGFRKEGKDAIQDCFPKIKLGMFLGLHLVNDYMSFSPHIHAILYGTGIDERYWPLSMDQSGGFPMLGEAWRSVVGGRGKSVRELKQELLIHWADRLSDFSIEYFLQCKAGFIKPETFTTANIAFNLLTGMTVEEIKALKPIIQQAVLSDPSCVYVKPIQSDLKAKELNPAKAFQKVVEYAVARPFKHTDFRDLGGGMVCASFLKDGERKYVGDFQTMLRHMLQYFSVYRVRKYETYGLFHMGGGCGKRKAFIKAMNAGYPRAKKARA